MAENNGAITLTLTPGEQEQVQKATGPRHSVIVPGRALDVAAHRSPRSNV
jgi:hypothetical protein